MVCYYCYSCIDLPVVLVDFQVEVCALRLHHVCRGEYVTMHKINIDRVDRKICLDFFDELRMGGKTEKIEEGGT